jgi:glucose-1-phosphate cytidylyltransferase
MKVIILAGGFGTRLSEETVLKPKPMVEIGGKPILWHIMNIYAAFGLNEFIVALGYKGEFIKEYFLNFYAINNDITIDLATGKTAVHEGNQPNWKIHLVDTGLYTQTGGRLKRLRKWIAKDDTFMLTYGDGVADINLKALLEFHKSHDKIATVTTVRSPARFGRIAFKGEQITDFYEKPQSAEGWINGGFFVLNPKAIDYIENDETIWECMDTLKEKNLLEELWNSGKAPWKVW